jgi:flagellar basal body-associated protein FliL
MPPDPFLSKAKKEERAAEKARMTKIRWILIGLGVVVVLGLAGVYFVSTGGKPSSPSGEKVTPQDEERKRYDTLNEQIENVDSALTDPKLSAKDKKMHQTNKENWEKQKKEIQAKHPDWK